MLKYQKIKPVKKADSPLTLVFSVVQFLLVLLGLVGISIQTFEENGWLKHALASVVGASNFSLIIGIPIALVVALVGKSWLDSHSEGSGSHRTADLMLYCMMLVGAWFLYKLITEGGF